MSRRRQPNRPARAGGLESRYCRVAAASGGRELSREDGLVSRAVALPWRPRGRGGGGRAFRESVGWAPTEVQGPRLRRGAVTYGTFQKQTQTPER